MALISIAIGLGGCAPSLIKHTESGDVAKVANDLKTQANHADKELAFLVAIKNNNPKMVETFLKSGFFVNYSIEGVTPLMLAAAIGSDTIVNVLLRANADPKAERIEWIGVTSKMGYIFADPITNEQRGFCKTIPCEYSGYHYIGEIKDYTNAKKIHQTAASKARENGYEKIAQKIESFAPEKISGWNTQPWINYDSIVDERDGKKYRTVTIGSQTWMAENLNYSTDSSWCYENDSIKCVMYGRLYTYNSAVIACPIGWSPPKFSDWKNINDGGRSLKSRSWNGLDAFGFNAIPAGIRWNTGKFENAGVYAKFWNRDESRMTIWDSDKTEIDGTNIYTRCSPSTGLSVRCIKNPN